VLVAVVLLGAVACGARTTLDVWTPESEARSSASSTNKSASSASTSTASKSSASSTTRSKSVLGSASSASVPCRPDDGGTPCNELGGYCWFTQDPHPDCIPLTGYCGYGPGIGPGRCCAYPGKDAVEICPPR
jgi:hypothetical protein